MELIDIKESENPNVISFKWVVGILIALLFSVGSGWASYITVNSINSTGLQIKLDAQSERINRLEKAQESIDKKLDVILMRLSQR